ncbi:MAG TPA: glycosyltransferase family 39 protein [Gemmatimonadaceae bacterium]|jgi:ADP-heptose:LPS heptosyltransferase|nr:glycosyltransferase family 39 protein [Gemmatimonadaceae bacterium]
MHLRTQKLIDNYAGGAAIAVLRPATMLLGALLRRNHELTVGQEVVWVKMLGGGSLVLAMPMLLGFRKAHPNVRMVLVTTPAVQPFAELLGVFDEYRIIDTRSSFALLWTALVALITTFRADCIVDLEVHSRLTTVFTTLTMARNRVAFWLDHIFWRRGLASHLVFFNRSSGSFYFYDRIGDLFGVKPASRADCERALGGAIGQSASTAKVPGQVAVGFACSDLALERMLSPEQWSRAFRDHLRPEHQTFIFLGAPSDRAKGDAIIDALRDAYPALTFRNACGDLSIKQSVEALFESAEFWGIDSSLLHLARTAGLHCVSYWGPTDPSTLTREAWTDVEERQYYRKIACSPCVHTSESPPCRGDNRCIKGLFEDAAVSPSNWTPMEYPPQRTTYPALPKKVLTAAWQNLGFICVAFVLVYCLVHAFDPPRLNWGDSASDYNVMTSGRNFAKYGFLHLRLTPFVLDPAYMTNADSAMVYTHYPQLPDLMNGLERTVFGFTDLVQFRLVALIFSFSALFFVYRLVGFYWSRQAAQLSLALWVINPLWIQHADYLHHAPYAAFFGFGALYFLFRHLNERRLGFLFASGAFVFLVFMASYDFWIFVPLLLAMMTFGHYRKVSVPAVRVLGALAGCAVAALLAKWATNAWALGGVAAFVRDLRFQMVERATNQAVRVAYDEGIATTLVGRVERSFTLLLFPVAAFWALYPAVRRRVALPGDGERATINPVFILLAALPFLALFTELWVGQYYPTLLVLPFYAIGCAVLAIMLIGARQRVWHPVGFVLVAALAANSIVENAKFKKAFLPRSEIAALKKEIDAVTEPGQRILVDHVFDAAYRYYFNHNTVALILNPPWHYAGALRYYADPKRPVVAPPSGAIFVQHKHLADQLFDKGLYYVLGREGLWVPWGHPDQYHAEIDRFITARDSELVADVAAMGGQKIQETDSYVVWRIMPRPSTNIADGPVPPPGAKATSDGDVRRNR